MAKKDTNSDEGHYSNATIFSTANASIADESVEVEAQGSKTIVNGEVVMKGPECPSPYALQVFEYPNSDEKDIDNETSTTTVTLVRPSPSTSCALKEAQISSPVYNGPASGLPPLHHETHSEGSSRMMKVIVSKNGLREGKKVAPRPKKSVTEWLAGVQYTDPNAKRLSKGNNWMSPTSKKKGLADGTPVAAVRTTRKHGLKHDENASVEISVEDTKSDSDASYVYAI